MEIADAHSLMGGLGTLWRMTKIAFLTPWVAAFAIAATLVSSVLQLMIPRLLGQAIDLTQTMAQDQSGAARAA